MEFEYDEKKSLSNEIKHGINFIEAQKLFNNSSSIYYEKTVDNEERFSIINYLDKKCFVAIFTIRKEKIRIISVRRCRKNEKQRFENENNSK